MATVFTPEEIVAACEAANFHKEPTLENAMKVFSVDTNRLRESKYTSYLTYSATVLRDGKPVTAPLHLKVFKQKTFSALKSCADWKSKHQAPITFSVKKTGTYGQAKVFIHQAFALIWREHVLVNTKIFNAQSEDISEGIQSVVKTGSDGKMKRKADWTPLEDPLFRVQIVFDRDGERQLNTTKLQIRDATKSIDGPPGRDGKPTRIPAPATVDGVPVNRENIHMIFKGDSTVSGIEKLDSICLSKFGTSIPSSFETRLYVTPGNGNTIDPDDVLDAYDLLEKDAVQVDHSGVSSVTSGMSNVTLSDPKVSTSTVNAASVTMSSATVDIDFDNALAAIS